MTHFTALFTAVLVMATASIAKTEEYKVGSLKILKPWTRATPKGSKVAGGFMTIHNAGKTADVLIGGTFKASARFEIHEMAIVNDVMKMRELANGFKIEPGASVVLTPGSYHVMFMGLKRQLTEGGSVPGTLKFAKAGTVDVTYRIEAMGKGRMKRGSHGGKSKTLDGHKK
jgi:copper(I)-binding protein